MSEYRIEEKAPPLDDFLRLREITGLTVYSREAAEKGLKGTTYGVSILDGENIIGMGRLVGDDGCVFVISDIAVDPAYQGKGLGKVIMKHIMDYVNSELPFQSLHLSRCRSAGGHALQTVRLFRCRPRLHRHGLQGRVTPEQSHIIRHP